MGNKVSPESIVKDMMDEKRGVIWGMDKEQKRLYPHFWPAKQDSPTNQTQSSLIFGTVYQFPRITPDLYELFLQKKIGQLPIIDYSQVDAPCPEMLLVLSNMQSLLSLWKQSIEKKDIFILLIPYLKLMEDHGSIIEEYLFRNFYSQLNYFGLVDARKGKGDLMEKKLPFIPENFKYGSIFFILLIIEKHFENENAPFLEWKKNSSIRIDPSPIPTLNDFKDEILKLGGTNGNFWTTMNNNLKSVLEVNNFWVTNRDLMIPVTHFYQAMKNGLVTLTGTDGFTDNYTIRMSFFSIFKFKDSNGKRFFRFPYWTELIENQKFLNPSILNDYIRNYFYLMYHDIQLLIPKFFETPISYIHPTLEFGKIKPIDKGFILKSLDSYKDAWEETATWYLFDHNRPIWPPDIEKQEGENLPMFNLLVNFMIDNPPPPLKVPSMDFGAWERKTKGWRKVFDQQWKTYSEWVLENVLAKEKPNYVQPGGQLKNKEGELLFYEVDGKQYPLQNIYPDYGVMNTEEGSIGRGLRFLLPWTAAADWVWGDGFWSFANGLVKKVFGLVIQALKDLYELAKGILPYMLIILAVVVGGVVLIEKAMESKKQETT